MQSLLSYWGQTESPALICLWMMFTKSWQSFERLEVIVQNMKDMSQGLEKYDTVQLLESCAMSTLICLWMMFNKICSADKVLTNQSQLSKYVRVLEIRMQIFLESYAIPALILGANWVSCWFWESILCRQSRVIHKVAQVTVVSPHVQHSIPCSGCRISLHITAICSWSKGEGEIVHISCNRGLVLSD